MSRSKRHRVLIVDDEPGLRESLAEIFEDEGFDVATAADGGEALRLLEATDEAPPRVVVLDIMMPVLDGTEVYRRMQVNPVLAGIPVVVTSSDPSLAPSGLLIMKKPISVPRLVATVRQLCESVSDAEPWPPSAGDGGSSTS